MSILEDDAETAATVVSVGSTEVAFGLAAVVVFLVVVAAGNVVVDAAAAICMSQTEIR